jgi:hypothetical protein
MFRKKMSENDISRRRFLKRAKNIMDHSPPPARGQRDPNLIKENKDCVVMSTPEIRPLFFEEMKRNAWKAEQQVRFYSIILILEDVNYPHYNTVLSNPFPTKLTIKLTIFSPRPSPTSIRSRPTVLQN